MIIVTTPVTNGLINRLKIYDRIEITGEILTGRDAVLTKFLQYHKEVRLHELNINLQGTIIFHTAVSPAGIGPTSSNKPDIELSIPGLSQAGVKIHFGKGALKAETVQALQEHNAIFVVTPPVSALLSSTVQQTRVVAFAEEGMEALHRLHVVGLPGIVAIAHGETIFRYPGR